MDEDDDEGGFDSNAFENRMAGEVKSGHNFCGVHVNTTAEEWNQLFLATIDCPEWLEHIALAEAIQAMSCRTTADFEVLLRHTRRANETYRVLARRVYTLAKKLIK